MVSYTVTASKLAKNGMSEFYSFCLFFCFQERCSRDGDRWVWGCCKVFRPPLHVGELPARIIRVGLTSVTSISGGEAGKGV